MEFLHPAMWHVALRTWQWIHQVAAPCNVIRGTGMTCHWIRPVAAPCNATRSFGIMTLNSPGGRWLWFDMPLNSPKRPPYWNSTSDFDFDHITAVNMSFCTSLRNFIQIGPPSAEKITSCRLSGWGISAILDFRGPIMGSLKSLYAIGPRSSKLLSFWENRVFLHFGDRQTNTQTRSVWHHRCIKPLQVCLQCLHLQYPAMLVQILPHQCQRLEAGRYCKFHRCISYTRMSDVQNSRPYSFLARMTLFDILHLQPCIRFSMMVTPNMQKTLLRFPTHV